MLAKSEGRLIGGLADDELLKMQWYRAGTGSEGGFAEIKGVHGGFYQPSAEDVNCRLLCRATNTENEGQSGFGEWGPLVLDPEIRTRAVEIAARRRVVFEVERSKEHD